VGKHKSRALLGTVIATLPLALLLGRADRPSKAAAMPVVDSPPAFRGQFVAKILTEAFGDALIDQENWQYWVDYFNDPSHNACNPTVLRDVVYTIYTSDDFGFEKLYYAESRAR
jgi:hypothetical protein